MEKKITYIKGEKLGQGASGTVYKAKAKEENGEEYIVAIKEIKLHEEEGIPPGALREIYLLRELNHINIERLRETKSSQDKISLIFEYIETDLKKILKSNNYEGLPTKRVKSFMYQLLKGVSYMHKYKIIHRDLKPSNLLITKNDILKLADFGLARGFGLPIRNYHYKVVTLYYRAPDVLLGNQNYTTSIDMWSIGCIFQEMINGRQLFIGSNESQMLKKIFYYLGTPDYETYPDIEELHFYDREKENILNNAGKGLRRELKNIDDVGYDLLMKFLQVDPDKRISAEDALKHPYFNDIDQQTLALYKNEEVS